MMQIYCIKNLSARYFTPDEQELEAIPFMLLGSLVGGLIEAFVSRERMTSFLPQKGWLTVYVAAGAGMVFPVSDCAVEPLVRRLVGKGLPLSEAAPLKIGLSGRRT